LRPTCEDHRNRSSASAVSISTKGGDVYIGLGTVLLVVLIILLVLYVF
jgi:hypothetical protein